VAFVTPIENTPAGGAPGGARLQTIDALRGAAAMGVLLFHASDARGLSAGAGVGYAALESILNWGRYGVWLFFVISGFCIHLSWAKRSQLGPAGPPAFGPFWLRRFRRLYPAYFAAIFIYVACLAVERVEFTSRVIAGIGLHLVFLQNFVPWGIYTVNEVMWTLAIEEQLYLLYFVFLAIRIRFGPMPALAAALAGRVLWFGLAFLMHRFWNVDILVTQAALPQWFIWVLGAIGVEAWLGLVRLPAWTRQWRVAIAILPVAAVVSYLYMYVLEAGAVRHVAWFFTDILWGLGFFVLVNKSVTLEGRTGRFAGWLARVGLFSYSLYLTHELITAHAWNYLIARMPELGRIPSLILLLALVAASVVLARIFFRWLERPFLTRTRLEPAPAAPRIQY
jgi:peptidoglycan/LPS O-acetylase OafA/YrhL